MNWHRIGLAGLGCVLGFGLGRMSGAWSFEMGWTYIILSDILLLAAVFVSMNRMMNRTVSDKGLGKIMLLIVALFCASIVAARIGGNASDSNPARYVAVAAAFLPLATIRRNAHERWNTFAPSLVLILVPGLASVALAIAGDIEVRMEPILFIVATAVVAVLSVSSPAISDKRLGQCETGLAMTAAFLIGVTAISGSYDYDGRASALVGIIMATIGWAMGVAFNRWEFAPSRVLNWQNLVIGVWVGQFMPGAAVMTATALVVGWLFYGMTYAVAEAFRRNRRRRAGAA